MIKTVEDLHRMVAQAREETFSSSTQITLGELIKNLEGISNTHGDSEEAVEVEFDFGTAYPIGVSSWRGSYNELAVNYALSGYDAEQFAHTNLEDFKKILKDALGKEFTGWKGGDFTMTESTPLWVANDGNSGNTGVVGILDEGYKVVILTQYCEH